MSGAYIRKGRAWKSLPALALVAATAFAPGDVSAGTQSLGASALANPGRFNTPSQAIAVAADSTILAVIDSDADGTFDDLGISSDGGATFATIVVNVIADGTRIVDLVPSPGFDSDRNVFAGGGSRVKRSVDGGLTWANSGTGNTAFAVTDLAISPGFASGEGSLAVSFVSGGAEAVQTATCTAAPTCAAWTTINFSTPADGANEGTYALEFSANHSVDGVLLAIAASAGGAPCGRAGHCEVRSTDGSTFDVPVAINAAAAGAGTTARIAFPSGYNLATADNYLVATNVSVYRRSAGTWVDVTPNGGATPATSIVASGPFASSTVYVGASTPTVAPAQSTVYRSVDGGVSWTAAAIGGSLGTVHVALSPLFSTDNTVYASTTGLHGGFWKSAVAGTHALGWTSGGLLADNYTGIGAIYAAPSGSDLFAIFQGPGAADDALFRSSQMQPAASSAWTKTGYLGGADVTAAAVSQSFVADQTVYIGGGSQLARSTNGGRSFLSAFISPIPSGAVSPAFGISAPNASTVFVAATTSTMHRSTDSGATWTTITLGGSPGITDMGLSPNYTADTTVLLAVRMSSGAAAIYASTNGGASFLTLGTHPDRFVAPGRHQVAFDSSYATNRMVYSVTDSDVYRWTMGESLVWTRLSSGANVLGSAPANLPAGASDMTNVAVSNGVLYASRIGTVAQRGLRRALNPAAAFDGTSATQWFDLGWAGMASGSVSQTGTGVLDQGFVPGSTFIITSRGMAVVPLSAASNLILTVDTASTPDTLNAYTDLLVQGPTPISPPNGATVGAAPTLSWEAYPNLSGAGFTVRLSTDPTFQDPARTSYANIAPKTFSVTTGAAGTMTIPAFNAAQIYYWQVMASDGAAHNVHSLWSAVRAYSGSAGVPFLTYPTSAADLVQLLDSAAPGLTWTAVASATDYQVQLATNTSATSPDGSYTAPALTRRVGNPTPALQLEPGNLTPNTTYYWHVRPIFGTANGPYTTTAVQAGASGMFKTPPGVSVVPTPLLPNAANPSASQSNRVPLQPLFVWSEVAGSSNYELEASTDGTFTDSSRMVVNRTGVNQLGNVLAYKATRDLDPDTVYFWRVRASGGGSTSAYSAANAFTTLAPASPVPAVTVLAALEGSGNLELVAGYDYALGIYLAYAPGLPGNRLTTIYPNSVLFVTVNAETTIVVSGITFSLRSGKAVPVPVGDTVSITVV